MWAKPINLPGKPEKKHAYGSVLCSKCKKSNPVSEAARRVGQLICKRCGHVIRVARIYKR